jgi:hypothetical protein
MNQKYNLFGLEKKLKEKDIEVDHVEVTFHENIIILEKKLKEQILKNEAEANLHGHEKQSKEKAIERDHMEGPTMTRESHL